MGMFWTERLIINSVEELGFRGARFQPPIMFHPSQILSGNGEIITLAIS